MKEKIINNFSAAVREVFAALEHKTMSGILFSTGVILGVWIIAPLFN